MKQTIRLTESDLHKVIKESVKKIIKEWSEEYEGNDLDYDSVKMQAEDVIYKMQENGEPISWRSVAENMGFRLETLNGEDMELLKDAIQDAMIEGEEDAFPTESIIRRIVKESVNKVINKG